MAIASQSIEFDTLMDSVRAVLKFATSLNTNMIHEYYGEDRPNYDGQQHLVFRLTDWDPEMYSGAGRLASLTNVALEVVIWTQLTTDKAGEMTAWFRNQGRGHWKRLLQCLNAFDNKNLFSDYDSNGNPISRDDKLTIEPLQQLRSKFVEKRKDDGWGKSSLLFQLALVKPLTVS